MCRLPVRLTLAATLLGLAGCRFNNALAPESHITTNSGTSATPHLADPAATSTGGKSSGTGNGENAPGTSMPSGAGIKAGQLDKDNAAVVTRQTGRWRRRSSLNHGG